ncbi:MAG: preprotein translocase subunit YajC [Candidatus Hydrogenedentes bacterium]|jgi:preprotein translocase subunit YajC|nr:preprotein translocase subunit YajC [Candidatus Hydrogenedentota bacterium]
MTAQAQTDGASTPGSGGPNPIFILVIMVSVFYFLLIRPQQTKDKKRRAMLSALSKGDRVITNGGVLGTIVGLNDKTIVLKVSDNPVTKIEFVRGAVSQIAAEESN